MANAPAHRLALSAALALGIAPAARADSASILPQGAQVAYAGAGLTTFSQGVAGNPRDRQLRPRLDLYYAAGLTPWLQLSADAPLIHSQVLDLPAEGPCPAEGGYCDPITSVGEAGIHLRARALSGPVDLTFGAGLRSDAWNAPTRTQWNNVGQGVTSAVGSALVGGAAPSLPVGGVAWLHYVAVFGRPFTTSSGVERLPHDAVKAGLEGWAQAGPVRLNLAATAFSRLGGVDFGEEWSEVYVPTEDRWAALRYAEARLEAKVSLSVAEGWGIHAAASRAVWAVNGPGDLWDASLGAHHYFAPR